MSEPYDAIVVGGGIVGTAVLYCLARRGITNTLLLEKNELTSGSTWHAAGNCTHFGHNAEVTRLYVNSLKTYLEAETDSGQDIGFHKTGSLRLANTEAELAAYRSLEAAYQSLRIPYRVVDPGEIADLHPLISLEGVEGAAHTSDDGHVDPTSATMALARAARNRGATILTQRPVEAVSPSGGEFWELGCGDETFTTRRVIIAASFWSREMLLPIGIDLPVYAIEHHELITESHPSVASLGFELPTIRDPWIPGNIRQEGDGFLIGVYEKTPVAWNPHGIPPEFGQELLPPNIDRLMPHLDRCIQRFPLMGESGIKAVNNGPISFAPDGFPLLGPVSSHPGLWLATAFHIGIGTGGGAARFLCDWIIDGTPPYQLGVVHPDRFSQPIATDEAVDRVLSYYAAGYARPDSESA